MDMGSCSAQGQVFLAVFLFLHDRASRSPAYGRLSTSAMTPIFKTEFRDATTSSDSTGIGMGLEISLKKEVWFEVFTKQEVACSAQLKDSNDSVSFSWFLNNSRIDHYWNGTSNNITVLSFNSTSSRIVFANVTRDQLGYYTCKGRVNQLQKSVSVRVNVGDVPLPPSKSTCNNNPVTGFQIIFHTQYTRKDIDTAIYTVFICKSTKNNTWCKNNKKGWKRACKPILENDYQIGCRLSTIHPSSSNTYVIKINARNKFGIRTKQMLITPALLACRKDIKPILKVKTTRDSAVLEVHWWIRNEAKSDSHTTMMYYKKTGSKDKAIQFTRRDTCTTSRPCIRSLDDLLPCTSYNVCVHHTTFASGEKTTCQDITTNNNEINIVDGIQMQPINKAKKEVTFVWNDRRLKDKGPLYYNCTLQTTLEGKMIERQKKVNKDIVLSFPCNMFAQDTTCKLEVKKCTNCGCGHPVSSPVESCGAKCNIPIQPKGNKRKEFSKEGIVISVLVGIFGICLFLAIVYGIRRYRQSYSMQPEEQQMEDRTEIIGPDEIIGPRTLEVFDECSLNHNDDYQRISM